MQKEERKTIFVGLSGGVDSSVAALRLQQAGHTVIGVFIKVWQPDFIACDWERERQDAMRVAATLGIPFYTFDAEAAYKQYVVDYLISEYTAGRTPNPDIMCNQHVKFGVFFDYAREHGADAIATGHYAQIKKTDAGLGLYRGADPKKDQSYFLWTLTKDILARVCFPVGMHTKEEIRREADHRGLPTANKKDSQGICFLGQIDMKEFLSQYVSSERGPVLDTRGNTIGHHDGALFYTVGQRHGFTITHTKPDTTPFYVTGKDVARNTLFVDTKAPVTTDAELDLSSVNWITTPRREGEMVEIVTRYRGAPRSARITAMHNDRLSLVSDSVHAPAAGQSCVLYDGDACLGGGIIDTINR